MKLNKKGFTLIELLAVIVVLGIILAIAIPKVVDTIENARKGAFISSVKNAIRAAELKVRLNEINGTNNSDNSIANLGLKGEPLTGTWEANNGVIKLFNVETANQKYHLDYATNDNIDILESSVISLTEPFTTLVSGEDGITITNNILLSGEYEGSNKYIIIPDGVETIDASVFWFGAIDSIKLPSSLETIGETAFYMSDLTTIIIPSNVSTIGSNALLTSKLTAIINTTNREFDWIDKTGAESCNVSTGTDENNFITGTCTFRNGKILNILN